MKSAEMHIYKINEVLHNFNLILIKDVGIKKDI